jgi:hypothetical protein
LPQDYSNQQGKSNWITPVAIVGGLGALVLGAYFIFFKGSTSSVGVFTFGQPKANPAKGLPGNKTTITCPIAMGEGDKFTGQVIVKVEEGGVPSTPGDLLYQKIFNNVKFLPGESQDFKFDWNFSGSIGMKDVEVFVNKGNQAVDSHHFDDVIEELYPSLLFSCNQPIVTPDNAPLGTTVQIACPIVSWCNGTVSARVRMQVSESSWLPWPGDLLEEQVSDYQDISPGQTKNYTFPWVSTGAIGSKDVSVFIEVNDQEAPGGNHFDDALHVT